MRIKFFLIIGTCMGLASCAPKHKVESVHYSASHGATAPKTTPTPPPGANGTYVPSGHKPSPDGMYDDIKSKVEYKKKKNYPERGM